MASELERSRKGRAFPRGPYWLQSGDHLRREEFERRYDATPGLKKAELIEGVVYVHEPVRHREHAAPNGRLVTWLGTFASRTPGTHYSTDGTLRLDDDNEPQPDGVLFIDSMRGGTCRVDEDGYLSGAPELVVEVAASTASYDLHCKLRTYRRSGVREYLVARTVDQAVDWFSFEHGRSINFGDVSSGMLRSEVFPGLWLDVDAFLSGDDRGLLLRLEEGLATTEHAALVQRLQVAAP